jgi:hypothetical protein
MVREAAGRKLAGSGYGGLAYCVAQRQYHWQKETHPCRQRLGSSVHRGYHFGQVSVHFWSL